METTTLTVGGMHCAGCAKRVERALSGIPGVASSRVDLIAGRAAVDYDPAQTSESALKEAVRAAGYRVSDGT
jgi:Cu+-exporting ATPase